MHRSPGLPSRRHRPTLRMVGTAAAVATMAALSVSCAADGDSAVADPATPSSAAAPTSSSTGATTTLATDGTTLPSIAAPAALQFTAPLVGGGSLDLASYAGSTVLFWFWAPG